MSTNDKQPPPILYHYTTVEVLKRIVESKSLWASKIQHLNDAKEFRHAIGVARGVISTHANARDGRGEQFFHAMQGRLNNLEEMDSFAASLSEKADDLSQWRAYSNSGLGVAVGFDSQALRAAARSSYFDLVKCSYETTEQRASMSVLVQDAIKEAGDANLSLEGGRLDSVISTFLHSFSREACRMKSRHFESEAEWRLVWRIHTGFENDLTELRINGSMLVPYKVIDLKGQTGQIDCIAEIILGPNPHMTSNALAICRYLGSRISSPLSVKHSEVPYRNW